MDPRTLFSKISPRVKSTVAVVLLVICLALMSSGQTGPALTTTISGPYSFKDTPIAPSYIVTLTNISPTIVSSINLSDVLSASDGAYLIGAKPSQGSCEQGGQGITMLNCSLGSLDSGASIIVNVAAQMVSGTITLSSSASGIDATGSAFSSMPVQRTTVHGNPPAGTPVISISLSANPTPKDLVGGRAGTLNWTLQNSTGVRANQLTLAMVIDSRMRIISSAVTGSNAGDPVSCTAPVPGDQGANIVFCNIGYLGGSSGGSGGTSTVTQLQVAVNYTAPVVSAQTTLLATGYLSFDGSDSSNPTATGQVRVK